MSNTGPVNMCLYLIQRLDMNDYDVKIIALGGGDSIDLFSQYGDVEVFSRKRIAAFRKYIKKGGFDIIHSHTIIADLFLKLSKTKAEKLTTIHNYPDIDSIYRRGRVIGGFLYQLQKYAIKDVLKVACSHAVKEYCQEKLKMDNILTISNGVPAKKNLVRESRCEIIHFYYLGSLSKRKNVDELLKAFDIWCNDKNSNLNVIGNGELLSDFSEKYSNNKKIIFHGKIDKPDVMIRELDCFVSSSRAEGMPLALLESLSLGKAYICSDIAPHREVFNNDNGHGGYVYKLGNIHELIKAFDDYYNNSHKELMSFNAKRCFENYYDARLMSADYDRLYKTIVTHN